MAYLGAMGRRDRAKAIAAVVLVHGILGGVILSGVDVRSVGRAGGEIKAFQLTEVPPPPPPEPPPPSKSKAEKEQPAPPNLRSKPTPVVAPPARIPLPSPVTVATTLGPEGAGRTAGAGTTAGPGTGAGG